MKNYLREIKKMLRESQKQANKGSFAYSLQTESLKAHMEELAKNGIINDELQSNVIYITKAIDER